MSLVGNLEDLGLGDILQIVSLSRKSGVLNLTWEARKGKILFRDGQVVSAISNEVPSQIETLLSAPPNPVSPEAIAEAKALKRGIGKGKSLEDILVERLGVSKDDIENRVKDHIEKIVYYFFGWTEGNFNFDLKEGQFEDVELGEEGFILKLGINPQFLAMEGTRLQDEAKRSGTPVMPPTAPAAAQTHDHHDEHPGLHDAFTETHLHETPAEPEQMAGRTQATDKAGRAAQLDAMMAEAKIPQVLVVDDDPEILKLVDERLRGLGLTGLGLLKVNEALRKIDELIGMGHCPVVIADLFMPRTDGEGILGGLELVQTAKTKHHFIPIILISDYPNEAAEKEARAYGLDHYIDKPKRSQIWGDKPTPELVRFTEALRDYLPELVSRAIVPKPEPTVVPGPSVVEPPSDFMDLGMAIREEFGEAALPSGGFELSQTSRGLNLLKTMINELNDPTFSGQITLMVLRFASELMNRAIIFLVARDQVAGLGQFGVELHGIDALKQVRRMRIPISEPSVFREIIQRRSVYKKPLADTEWNNYLVKYLGGERPVEVFGAPIMAGGRIAAIIYGDNVPEQKSIGDTDSLEIFLAQAGLAMERAFLERRISELSLKRA